MVEKPPTLVGLLRRVIDETLATVEAQKVPQNVGTPAAVWIEEAELRLLLAAAQSTLERMVER